MNKRILIIYVYSFLNRLGHRDVQKNITNETIRLYCLATLNQLPCYNKLLPWKREWFRVAKR